MAMQQQYASTVGYRPNRHYSPFKQVGIFVPKLIRETCRRRGIINVDIVLRWGEIVGKALAKYTWPMRIQWPRRQETILKPDGTEAPSTHKTRLVVGVKPGKVLDVEMAKHDIMARVNGYLGYRAVTELHPSPDYSIPDEDYETTTKYYSGGPKPKTDGTANDLQTALARLGQGIKDRKH
jgi:hypothetical protein